ncbi:hypothetical protein V1515DRAFT_617505 [Lipomyces mesembrius]
MAANRRFGRDIFIYLASNPTVIIGGGFTNPTFKGRTFLDSLDVLITHDLPLRVFKINDGRMQIQRTQDPLLPGEYEVESDGYLAITDAPYYQRTYSATSSLSSSGRVKSFPAAVRERDRRCVITGVAMTQRELGQQRWTRYEAAHIFPNYNFRELVVLDECDGSVNSPQNGLLLQSHVHAMFDQYEISINPNDDYRIVCFLDDSLGLAGRQLDPVCRDRGHPHHLNDKILFWHFQQAVLANMRGAGEPIFDEVIPSGSDTMNAIRSGPVPAERMELELSKRLGDVMRAQGSFLIK